MTKDNSVYLRHILESLNRILDYTSGMKEQDFLGDKLVQDAVIRHFEIIGEATKNVSEEFKDRHPAVPWKKMAGMRDKLIHDYIGVDLWAVWAAVQSDIPALKEKLEKILK